MTTRTGVVVLTDVSGKPSGESGVDGAGPPSADGFPGRIGA
ncbi:hypothetical protein [Actinoplanes sp. NPDC026623]